MPSHLLHEKETFFGWRSMAFQKLIFYHFLDKFFLRTFLLNNWILQKNFNFCKFAIFLQILKVEHKSFPMMYHLSYLDIKHRIQRGGGQRILVFKYLSRDRVKYLSWLPWKQSSIAVLRQKIKNMGFNSGCSFVA